MRLPDKEDYSLEEIANQRNCRVDDLLHYAEINKLEICVYIYEGEYEVGKTWNEREKEYFPGGPCPVWLSPGEWRKIRMYGHPYSTLIKHPQKEAYLFPVERDYAISEYVVTNKERLRFEKECARKKEMGTEERENLLRLIGALIEQNYQGTKYKKRDGSPNASAISDKFHGWLIDNYFSDKGISDTSFRKLIPEAYNLIMENKEEETKTIIKKIYPT